MQKLPSRDPEDPEFRRLKYVRYADDFLLGFVGPREEAEEIKSKLDVFLRDRLKLELSNAKTLITHARKEAARFLGYEVCVLHNDRKHTNGRRSINAQIGLRVPREVIDTKCQDYVEGTKPIHRPEMMKDSALTIISTYQAEYRGMVQYYRMAYNLSVRLPQLKDMMERSLTKTLAAKFQITTRQVYRKYHAPIVVNEKPYKGLRATIERVGRKPKPSWTVLMISRQRKTIVVCKTCHEDIQAGRPMRRPQTNTGFMHGEQVASRRKRSNEKTL
jgi:Type II intron maturase/Reverse transcriptase (RNA-dependent DNA polymerase)